MPKPKMEIDSYLVIWPNCRLSHFKAPNKWANRKIEKLVDKPRIFTISKMFCVTTMIISPPPSFIAIGRNRWSDVDTLGLCQFLRTAYFL